MTPLPGAHLSDGASRTLPSAWLGVSANWDHEAVSQGVLGIVQQQLGTPIPAFESMKLRALRYPGGSVSGAWDYASGSAGVNANPVPLSVFTAFCSAHGLRPVVVLGISKANDPSQLLDPGVAGDLAEMTARVAAFAAGVTGSSILHVEIGNEVYDNQTYTGQTDAQYGALSAADYADRVVAWLSLIDGVLPASAYPSLRFAVSLSHADLVWNQDLIAEVTARIQTSALDPGRLAVTVHPYYSSTACDENCAFKDSSKKGFWVEDACQAKQWSAFAEPWVDAATPGGAAYLVGRAQRSVSQIVSALDPYASYWLGQVPCWITETNVFNRCGPDRNTWAAGLAMLAHLFALLDARIGGQPWVELCTPHTLTHGKAGHQLIYDDTNSFAFLNDGAVYPFVPAPPVSSPVSEPWKWSPAGLAVARLATAIGTATTAVRLEFSEQATVTPTSKISYPALQGWRFPQPGGKTRYLLANFSGVTRRVHVPWAPYTEALIDNADPTRWITRPADVTHTKVPLSRGGEDMPAWSILLTEVP